MYVRMREIGDNKFKQLEIKYLQGSVPNLFLSLIPEKTKLMAFVLFVLHGNISKKNRDFA